jgi:nicotinamidase-related amidase
VDHLATRSEDAKSCTPQSTAGNEIVVHKPSYGAFYDTPLQTILTNLSRDTIVICGHLDQLLLRNDRSPGYGRGFNVVVVGDLTATDDRELHEAELKTLRKGFARVLSLEELLAELRQRGSPLTRGAP